MTSAIEARNALSALKETGQVSMKALSQDQIKRFQDSIAQVNAMRAKSDAEKAAEADRMSKVKIEKSDTDALAAHFGLDKDLAATLLRKAGGDLTAATAALLNSEPYPELIRVVP